MQETTITHVIFDMDGLLLDTETFYTIAQQEICKHYGKDFTFDLKSKMMGQKAIEAAQIFVDDLNLSHVLTAQQFLDQREAILDKLFPESNVLPGVERLLHHLKAHKIPMALATSSHHRHFQLKTTNHTQLFSLFDHVVTGDQVQQGKPHPEIFLTALNKWGLDTIHPSQCLVFEDAPSGVVAAKRAGMNCVMVPDPRVEKSDREAADEVLESLEQFDPVKYGLPQFLDR